MKKILVGFVMDGKAGGIDKYLLNFLETVDKEKVQLDFLTNEIDDGLKHYLEKYHSQLFAIANLKHPLKQYRQVQNILRAGKYDAVYLNISTAIDCVAAIAAKKEGIEKRMLHSHSSGNDCENVYKRKLFDVLHNICKTFLWKNGTHFYACSIKAGEWLFPKKIVESEKFEVIFNAVDREKFQFDETVREEMRNELGLKDKFVIGHVGNFCYQKNHVFLIEVFRETLKKNPNAVLLLIGKGVQFEDIKRKVREMGMEQSVYFLGWRQDVNRLFQAMDLFLLPSNFEGLPIVGVEAQSSGLPCVMSDTITKEAKITEKCEFISLKAEPKEWAERIVRNQKQREAAHFLKTAENYDLEKQKEQLKQIVQD